MILVPIAVIAFVVVGALLWRGQLRERVAATSVERLRAVPIFATLSDAQLGEIAQLIGELRIHAGQSFIREDATDSSLYLIVAGRVQILKRGTYDQTLVSVLGAGAFLGEMALLTGRPRIASAQAIEDSILLVLKRRDFRRLTTVLPDIGERAWDACDLHTIENLIGDHYELRQKSPEERQVWIASRQVRTLAAGAEIAFAASGTIMVIAGSLRIASGARSAEQRLVGPAFWAVDAGERLTAVDTCRLAILPPISGAPNTPQVA